MTRKQLDGKDNKDLSKEVPPPSDEIFTSRKHSMDYFTVDGVILRTGYSDKRDWYLLSIRELLDNAADFLTKSYKGADNASITVDIYKNDNVFRLKVKNSNSKDIAVFQDLTAIFDYDMRYGSKQNVHIISRGALGDALKQILSFGYVLINIGNDDGSSFIDKQWEQPLIIRHNGEEFKVYLTYDKAKQEALIKPEQSIKKLTHTDTEIELVLPIIDEVKTRLNKSVIQNFCQKYPLFTTDISFNISIIDDSNYYVTEADTAENNNSGGNLVTELIAVLKDGPQKATLKINYPALHPISTEQWNKQNTTHSYKPEEFTASIVNIHNKTTKIFDRFLTYREGSNIRKTEDYEISVAKLLSLPKNEQNRIISSAYKDLKKALDPPTKLVLPYSAKKDERRDALISRLTLLYGDRLEKDAGKAIYRLVHDCYDDTGLRKVEHREGGKEYYTYEKGKGLISFPFAFEIIAIPFTHPTADNTKTEFIGAVNYSVSAKEDGNIFEGDYSSCVNKNGYYSQAKNIISVLEDWGFHKYHGESVRLPCIIAVNLITPRRDPHGYDKSRIDTHPFVKTIYKAVGKVASGIKTFRAAGWMFSDKLDFKTAKYHDVSSGKKGLEEVLRDWLVGERGLPA